MCNDWKVCADWVKGSCSGCWSDVFCQDDAIAFQLAWAAFPDSPGEIHFIPSKGKTLQSSRQVHFECKGHLVGVNMACLKCDFTRDVTQKMHCKGELRSWKWDKHCSKFPAQIKVIDEWVTENKDMSTSNKDQSNAFLMTIPKGL
jgi:hypothetical protein